MSPRFIGRRSATLGLLALGLAPALAACNTSPGGAAVIGGNRISISTLQAQVNQALISPTAVGQLGGNRDAAVRAILSRLVQDQLVEKVAAQHGLSADTSDIQKETQTFISQNGGTASALQNAAASAGYSQSQLQEDIRQAVLIGKLETALTANLSATQAQLQAEYKKDIDNYDQLDIAQIEVGSKSLAESILSQVQADPSKFAELAKKDSTDTQTASNGGHVGLVGRSQVVSALGNSTASLKPGSFSLVPNSGSYVVVHVISRRTQPLTSVEPALKAAIFANEAPTILTNAIIAESKKLGVHISPRYGSWNAKTQAVAASKSTISFAS